MPVSCSTRALAVALLRARGIGARTISHIPIWGGWMDGHWMLEYWHPGEGWIWLESALNQFEPSPNSLVILAVSELLNRLQLRVTSNAIKVLPLFSSACNALILSGADGQVKYKRGLPKEQR